MKRVVRVSVCLPVSVELVVQTNDPDPEGDEWDEAEAEWDIVEVRKTQCEVTPRMVAESMSSVEWKAMSEAAAKAKDLGDG